MVAVAACGGGGAAGTEITFGTRDGFQLTGTVSGTGERGIVLAHAEDADRRSWVPLAGALAAEGFVVLAFDFRGYGATAGERSPATTPRDVDAAVEALRSRGARQVAVVGAGAGGLAALTAAGTGSGVAAVVAVSPPAAYEGLSAESALLTAFIPKLFVVAADDGAGVAAAELLAAVSPEPRQIAAVPGDTRGADLVSEGPGRSEVVAFLREVLA